MTADTYITERINTQIDFFNNCYEINTKKKKRTIIGFIISIVIIIALSIYDYQYFSTFIFASTFLLVFGTISSWKMLKSDWNRYKEIASELNSEKAKFLNKTHKYTDMIDRDRFIHLVKHCEAILQSELDLLKNSSIKDQTRINDQRTVIN